MGKLSEIGTAYAAERVAKAAYEAAIVRSDQGHAGHGDVLARLATWNAAILTTIAADQDYINDPEVE